MLQLTDLSKVFRTELIETHALRGINLTVNEGEFVALTGPSGSGKSTLLNVLGTLESFDGGDYLLDGQSVKGLSDRTLSALRNEKIGFIFQGFNLIKDYSLYDNIELPLRYRGMVAAERKRRVERALELVGLGARKDYHPSQLSGGQQQRVAIARALSMDPVAMLFDEPTSALDPEMVNEVLDVMTGLAQEGMTMMVVTHEMGFARRVANRIVFMDHGRIVEDTPKEAFFTAPESERARDFLARIIH